MSLRRALIYGFSKYYVDRNNLSKAVQVLSMTKKLFLHKMAKLLDVAQILIIAVQQ